MQADAIGTASDFRIDDAEESIGKIRLSG